MKSLLGRLILLTTAAAVILYFMAGCMSGNEAIINRVKDDSEERKTIGLSLYYRQDEFYKYSEEAFVKEAEKRGYDIVVRDANADLAKQVQHLEDFISMDVDLILMSAVEPNKIIATVELVNRADIPIIAYDEPPRGGKILSYVVWDNYKAGRMIGEWAKNYIEEELGGKAQIAILDLPSQYLCMERVRGFKEVMGTIPGAEIAVQQDYKADRASSIAVTEKILNENSDIDLILGVTDDAAFGAIAVAEALEMDIAVLSAGSWSVESMRALAQGSKYYKANVTISPFEQAKTTFDVIDTYFNGEEVKIKNYITTKVYDENNICQLYLEHF